MTPEELYSKLKDLRSEESIKAIAQPFDIEHRTKFTTLESYRNSFTPYNKLIKTIPLIEGENAYSYQKQNNDTVLKHFFYKYATPTRDEYAQMNAKSNSQKEERLDNGTLLEPSPYLEAVGKLLTSDDYRELAVGIISATGRRPCEVLLRGEFVLIKEHELMFPEYQPITHWLGFSGQLKKRRDTANERYPLASLFPADFIVKSVKRLRKMPEVSDQIKAVKTEMQSLIPKLKEQYPNPENLEYQIALAENDLVDNKFETITNRIVQNSLPQVLEVRHGKQRITRSSLRAAYACLATARDCPANKTSLLWASRLLGHKEEGGDLRAILTTAGYFDYYIEKDATVPLLDEPKAESAIAIRGFISDVNEVKEFQEQWGITNQPETFRKIWGLAKEAMVARERKLFDKVDIVEVPFEEVSTVVNKEELLSEVSLMIDEKLAAILEKIQSMANPVSVPTAIAPVSTPAATEPVPALEPASTPATEPAPASQKNWAEVTTEELRGKKIPGSAEEKIKRAVQAIFNYNDYSAPSNNERWFLGVRSIQDLSGCNYAPLKKFVDDYSTMIADHNAKYGLSNQHNKRHTKKITEIIANW